MKRVIMGLGVGVYILLFWVTPVPAFDRDINLPSQNVSDPIWIYELRNGDESGWVEPNQSPDGIILDVQSHINGKDIGSTKFLFNIVWTRFNHAITNVLIQINIYDYEIDSQQELDQGQSVTGR